MTALLIPLALWVYVLAGPDQHISMTIVLYAGLGTMLATTAALAVDFDRAVVKCRDMIEDGPPPHQLWRLASGMLSIAACLDIGWVAMAVVIAYVSLMEVIFEMAARPMGGR